MKRCPKCEFIYEEDQRLCDMDGAALIHDPRALVDKTVRPVKPAPRPGLKLFGQLGIPLVILSVVAFYVFGIQTGSQNGNPPSARIVNGSGSAPDGPSSSEKKASSNPDTAVSDVPTTQSSPADDGEGPKAPGRSVSNQNESFLPTDNREGKRPIKSASASPTPRRPLMGPRSQISPRKKDSKDSRVTSFLKKTGRLLKKPFQL
ncbi:MAG TPA: hypothetical protein VE135_02895 [Pyrinomonadaceae bacterium]|nr:hypothetical protein [Pyrinomonadaceae bacterium]